MSAGWPKGKGSEWRKWDLHIHSPFTKLNNQFHVDSGKDQDVWTEYCRRLHESDVHAFGITDYFSANGYTAAVDEYQARYSGCKKVFFPNIELRTNDVVNAAGQHVNVHLLFNPFQANFKEDIKRFLGYLEIYKTGAGGRHVIASDLKSEGVSRKQRQRRTASRRP